MPGDFLEYSCSCGLHSKVSSGFSLADIGRPPTCIAYDPKKKRIRVMDEADVEARGLIKVADPYDSLVYQTPKFIMMTCPACGQETMKCFHTGWWD